MRKILFSLAGAAALGLAGFVPQSAQAQGFSVQFGAPGYYGRPYYGGPYYGRPVYGYGAYGGGYGYGPRCFVRINRYWDGYGWVREKRRICR
jgi:hypothetical protein